MFCYYLEAADKSSIRKSSSTIQVPEHSAACRFQNGCEKAEGCCTFLPEKGKDIVCMQWDFQNRASTATCNQCRAACQKKGPDFWAAPTDTKHGGCDTDQAIIGTQNACPQPLATVRIVLVLVLPLLLALR